MDKERMKRLKFSQKWNKARFQRKYDSGELKLTEEEKKVLKKQAGFKP